MLHLIIFNVFPKASIDYILGVNGIEILQEHTLGKEFSIDKKKQLTEIITKTNAVPEEILFIDDNPKHLARVRCLGVNLSLATWGYNNTEGREEAKEVAAYLIAGVILYLVFPAIIQLLLG